MAWVCGWNGKQAALTRFPNLNWTSGGKKKKNVKHGQGEHVYRPYFVAK